MALDEENKNISEWRYRSARGWQVMDIEKTLAGKIQYFESLWPLVVLRLFLHHQPVISSAAGGKGRRENGGESNGRAMRSRRFSLPKRRRSRPTVLFLSSVFDHGITWSRQHLKISSTKIERGEGNLWRTKAKGKEAKTKREEKKI